MRFFIVSLSPLSDDWDYEFFSISNILLLFFSNISMRLRAEDAALKVSLDTKIVVCVFFP